MFYAVMKNNLPSVRKKNEEENHILMNLKGINYEQKFRKNIKSL